MAHYWEQVKTGKPKYCIRFSFHLLMLAGTYTRHPVLTQAHEFAHAPTRFNMASGRLRHPNEHSDRRYYYVTSIRMKHMYLHPQEQALSPGARPAQRACSLFTIVFYWAQQSAARLKSQVYLSLRHVFSIFSWWSGSNGPSPRPQDQIHIICLLPFPSIVFDLNANPKSKILPLTRSDFL